MFDLLLPFFVVVIMVGCACFIEACRSKKSQTLKERIYLSLKKLKEPIYWDVYLLSKLEKELKVKSTDVSECLFILERQGEIQRTYLDNKRTILVEKYCDPPTDNAMLTFVLIDNTLYMRKDNLNEWKKYNKWVIRLPF